MLSCGAGQISQTQREGGKHREKAKPPVFLPTSIATRCVKNLTLQNTDILSIYEARPYDTVLYVHSFLEHKDSTAMADGEASYKDYVLIDGLTPIPWHLECRR